MKKIKHYIISLVALLSVGLASAPVIASAASPATQFGATCKPLLTFPCWYDHIQTDKDGVPQLKGLSDVWVIALNVLDILIQVAGYAALGYIIWGGFKYIKSEGDPAKISEAKSAIMKAAIGLVLAISSIGIVQFVAGKIS